MNLPEDTNDDGDSIACPWCGSTMRDLWDFAFGSRETIAIECGECGKPFRLTQTVRVSYRASAIEPAQEAEDD